PPERRRCVRPRSSRPGPRRGGGLPPWRGRRLRRHRYLTPVIEKGRPWERPAAGPAQWQVEGDDATLAAAVRDHPGARVGFHADPTSDLARALGLHAPGDGNLELALDALRVAADDRSLFAVNLVVVGTAPDRPRWLTRAPS